MKEKFKIAEEILIVENNNKSILIGINTKLKNINPIILSGHLDTVAPDYDKYVTNPLTLTIVEDKAFGLGSIDMKSFMAIILDNLQKLKEMNYPIVVALTTDEETDLFCINNVISKLIELNIKPKFTIVGEPTKCEVNNVCNGCSEFEVKVLGKACHSSILSQGINAINIIAKLVSFIETEQQKFENLTSNVGVISGGEVVNKVPDYCMVKFDVRSTSKNNVDKFLNLIKDKINELENEYFDCKIELKKLLEIPPLENINENFIQNLADELNVKTSKFMGGCEAGYYQTLSGNAIIFGVGDIALAHKPNEYVVIKEYEYYSRKFLELMSCLEQELGI